LRLGGGGEGGGGRGHSEPNQHPFGLHTGNPGTPASRGSLAPSTALCSANDPTPPPLPAPTPPPPFMKLWLPLGVARMPSPEPGLAPAVPVPPPVPLPVPVGRALMEGGGLELTKPKAGSPAWATVSMYPSSNPLPTRHMALTCFCAAALPYLRGRSSKCDEKKGGKGGKAGEGGAETNDAHTNTQTHIRQQRRASLRNATGAFCTCTKGSHARACVGR
jgi:hypothetical protein